MSYVLLYVENADVVATFSSLDEARIALNAFVTEHPAIRDEVAVVETDRKGHGVGEYIYADQHSELFA